jgi:hypothetical protein
MSRRDAVTLASRTLAVLMTVWALTEVSHLPASAYSFRHYASGDPGSAYVQYWHHCHLIVLGFLITRITGYSLMARWMLKAGPEIEQLLLPGSDEPPTAN